MISVSIDKLRGDLLGKGGKRSVYIYLPNPNYVLKMVAAIDLRTNNSEYENYLKLREKYLHWIAPCIFFDDNIIIQARTYDIPNDNYMPNYVPDCFRDTKKSNWGLYHGRPVINDYEFIEEITDNFRILKEW